LKVDPVGLGSSGAAIQTHKRTRRRAVGGADHGAKSAGNGPKTAPLCRPTP